MNCRSCGHALKDLVVSLGTSPLANAYLTKEQLSQKEIVHPLEIYVCRDCFLVQLAEFESPKDIFTEYAYFSSYSTMWLKHAKDYVDKVTPLFNLGPGSFVVEIASNDGYLLQNFVAKGIPVLGIEPAENVAKVANEKSVPTESYFFGKVTAERLKTQGRKADLLLGNNILAHVPELNDFIAGLKILLRDEGVITMEFPHLLRLMEESQFDTIYHEHFSYFSFLAVEKAFARHGLKMFDVEELPTHGGSLRIYACHTDNKRPVSARVDELLKREIAAGMTEMDYYSGFGTKVINVKKDLMTFLNKAKAEGKTVAGYGAAAKGNTLFNYCGIKGDLVKCVADLSPHKQGRFLPGSQIPIIAPDKIKEIEPDYVLILPWNIKEEIMQQLSYIREWQGKFVIPIPRLEVL